MTAEEVEALMAEGVLVRVPVDLEESGRNGGADEHVAAFEDMREVRKDTEYGAEVVAASVSAEALTHARAIVTTVERDLE